MRRQGYIQNVSMAQALFLKHCQKNGISSFWIVYLILVFSFLANNAPRIIIVSLGLVFIRTSDPIARRRNIPDKMTDCLKDLKCSSCGGSNSVSCNCSPSRKSCDIKPMDRGETLPLVTEMFYFETVITYRACQCSNYLYSDCKYDIGK